jgi:hypothetical protein
VDYKPALGQSTSSACTGNSFNFRCVVERYHRSDPRQVVLVPAQKIALVLTLDIKQDR